MLGFSFASRGGENSLALSSWRRQYQERRTISARKNNSRSSAILYIIPFLAQLVGGTRVISSDCNQI